jgi:type I restriction enzyme S subunit
MSVPKLRFKEFKGKWEVKRIEEVTSYVDYRGKTPTKTNEGILLVTAKNIRFGYIDYEVSKEYVAEKDYSDVMRRGKPLLGDVLITTEAPLGNVATVDRENIALAQRVIKLRGNKGVMQNIFLKYKLLSPNFQNTLNTKATGGTAKDIKGSVLHKIEIAFPTFQEQTKIADFLMAVDEKIAQLTQKCELLARYKKGVMQQIF